MTIAARHDFDYRARRRPNVLHHGDHALLNLVAYPGVVFGGRSQP